MSMIFLRPISFYTCFDFCFPSNAVPPELLAISSLVF